LLLRPNFFRLISPLLFTSPINLKIDSDLSSEIDFKTSARYTLLFLLLCWKDIVIVASFLLAYFLLFMIFASLYYPIPPSVPRALLPQMLFSFFGLDSIHIDVTRFIRYVD